MLKIKFFLFKTQCSMKSDEYQIFELKKAPIYLL